MRRPFALILRASFSTFLAIGSAGSAIGADRNSKEGAYETIAREILDESKPAAEREKLIADFKIEDPRNTGLLIDAMANGLDKQPDLKEEYRRIPWIWRVAIAAGKRNQVEEVRGILSGSLPEKGEKLRDWQAVVIGGGLINGITLSGGWPAERIASIVAENPAFREPWQRVQDLASEMTEDQKVFKGTRYDAIRILGVGTWDRRGAQIFRYLLRDVDDELQMGAISALSDIRAPGIGQALLSGISHYSAKNRETAFDALIREDSRILELLLTVEEGRITSAEIGETRVAVLKKVADPAIRARVEKTLGTE